MLILLAALTIINQTDKVTVEYLYFSSPYCHACKIQTPIVEELNKNGYDFKIKEGGDYTSRYNVLSYPTFIVVITEKGKEIVVVKLQNRLWAKGDLKNLVRAVNLIIRLS